MVTIIIHDFQHNRRIDVQAPSITYDVNEGYLDACDAPSADDRSEPPAPTTQNWRNN